MTNNEIKKLFEVRVATTLYSAECEPWTDERANLDLENPRDVIVTRKGTTYEAYDYGEAPDEWDNGDDELYNKWALMQFEDGELARFELNPKRGKHPAYLYMNISGLLDDIASGYLELIPETINCKDIPSEYFSEIIKVLKIRSRDLLNQFKAIFIYNQKPQSVLEKWKNKVLLWKIKKLLQNTLKSLLAVFLLKPNSRFEEEEKYNEKTL